MAKGKTSILFTDDVGFDRYMDRRWEDPDFLSPELLAFFRSADHTCVNVEGAMIAAPAGADAFCHSMDPAAATVLEKIEADLWSLGNNHILGAGREGLLQTRTLAKSLGAQPFGAGEDLAEASAPVCLEEAGGIGIFTVAYPPDCIPATETDPGVLRWDDLDTVGQRIRQIKARCCWCLVVAHGGEEFTSLPHPYTRDRYLQYLALGADAVVGHHPHVPENYEVFQDGKAIFYSLGNFVFDTDYQRLHRYTDRGVLLKLCFTPRQMAFEAVGIQILREAGCIGLCPLPDIFTDIPAGEYRRLVPLSARAFLAENCRTVAYLEPERYARADRETWAGYYHSPQPKQDWDGYFPGAHMDFALLLPLARQAEARAWQDSPLERVKDHILAQIYPGGREEP